ncbi:MAG: carboxypeptidase-like regulatory domain-containing protein, partial [Acidobacteriaceae bacterium]
MLATSQLATAQNLSTGSLNVTVRDQAGAVVNGARLVLTDLGTNDVHKAVTAGAGTAAIPFLNPARYRLTVTMEGFSTKLYPSVTIQTNQVTDVDVTLQVGASTQTITVSGNATPLLDTTDNTVATTVDLKEVQDLPVFARDAFPLAFLVPGSVGNDINNL